VRFAEFLRVAVLVSAAAASLLAVLTVAGAANHGDQLVVPVAAGWWVLAGAIGAWLGRRAEASPPIAGLLANARTQSSLPEHHAGRILLNRLWPLLGSTVGAGALAFLFPQVPAVAAGFTVIFALTWRRQSAAVTAIEERDGARFYIEPTSPLRPIRLVRTPGFRTYAFEGAGNGRRPEARL
jgi:hypothetical protein